MGWISSVVWGYSIGPHLFFCFLEDAGFLTLNFPVSELWETNLHSVIAIESKLELYLENSIQCKLWGYIGWTCLIYTAKIYYISINK